MIVPFYDYRATSIKSSPDFYILPQCLCIQKAQATEAWLLSKYYHFRGGTLDDSYKRRGAVMILQTSLTHTLIQQISIIYLPSVRTDTKPRDADMTITQSLKYSNKWGRQTQIQTSPQGKGLTEEKLGTCGSCGERNS